MFGEEEKEKGGVRRLLCSLTVPVKVYNGSVLVFDSLNMDSSESLFNECSQVEASKKTISHLRGLKNQMRHASFLSFVVLSPTDLR